VKNNFLAHWRGNFLTGLAVVMPALISVYVLVLIFGNLTAVTDKLLFFLPDSLTHRSESQIYWYWSMVALALAVSIVCGIGVLARNYFGKRMIEWMDSALMHVPFLNKIYGATKQVNDALTSGNKESFKTVVLIEFPHPGTWSLGFLTSEHHPEVQSRLADPIVSVFVPATPNPTSGFLLFLPENKVTKLEMSVAEGIKYIISLGAIVPGFEKKR